MKKIGPHVSASGGVYNAPVNAMAVGASAFALFTKNQRQWFSAPLQQAEIEKFKAEVLKSGIEARYILPHDSYLINLGSPDPEGLEKSRASFLDFMNRGIEEGYFRKDVNYRLVPLIFDALGQHILSNSLLQQYSVEELYSNFFLIALRGFCTSKGQHAIGRLMGTEEV